MLVYESPEPITATVKIAAGDIKFVASDRADTTIDVQPRRPRSNVDVKAAEETVVEFTNGALSIKGPRPTRMFGRTGSVEVTVMLPSGSAVVSESAAGDVTTEGQLGRCRFNTAAGDFHVDHVGALDLGAVSGAVTVNRVDGDADVNAGGRVKITAVAGTAKIQNIAGNTWVGSCAGEVDLNTTSGNIVVEHAEGGVTARTVSGDVRLLDVVRGSVKLQAATGELEIGIREGTAAWLDVNTMAGKVRSSMSSAEGGADAVETVQVRASTFSGDILVHRA